jgi:hypothetical protein
MIYVKARLIDEDTIGIWADEILDFDSVPVLKDVCNYHLKQDKKIMMYLGGLLHVTREWKDFLQENQEKVGVVDPLHYMGLAGPNKN